MGGVSPSDQTEDIPAANFRSATAQWRQELADQIQVELSSHPVTRLTLSQAHPGGLAQLYAEHPTRLSNLVREPENLQRARQASLDVIAQTQHLRDTHGSGVVHLAIGTASWVEGTERRSTPVLLRPLDLYVGETGEVMLALQPGIEIPNRLMGVLTRYGVDLEPQQIIEAVRGKHGFSPAAGLQLLRDAGSDIPDLEVRPGLTIGIFSHPTSALLRELGAPQWLSLSPVARALAGDQDALDGLAAIIPDPNPNDRDPWQERGIGEQSPPVADVIEAATGTDSVHITTHGASVTVAGSIAAELAAQGKHVLVVTGQQQEILTYLEEEGVIGVANRVGHTSQSSSQVQQALLDATVDASDPLDTAAIDQIRTRLRRSRSALASYTDSLHQVFPAWGISAYDALQVLADLMSLPVPPSTSVRLTPETLSALSGDQGEHARELLEKAERFGMLGGGADRSWWAGVPLADESEVNDVLDALNALADPILDHTEIDMQRVADATGLELPATVRQWDSELALLRGIRDSLDVFQPQIYEGSAADMVVATASKEWRRERGINLPRGRQRQLVKQAKDLVLPGQHVDDLHHQLVLVQERRNGWRQLAGADSWPIVPDGLASILEVNEQLRASLDTLNPHLEPVYGDLFDLPIEELGGLVEALAAHPEGAREAPERAQLQAELGQLGLGDLLADLRSRGITGDRVSLELDLAWWATALALMLAAEPRLGGFDPSALQDALEEVRILEEAQITSLGPMVRHRIMELRQRALAASPQQFERLQSIYQTAMPASAYYAKAPISWDLMPIVLTSPTLVPQIVPWGRHIDVVLLVDVEHLPLGELIPVIARGNQVISVSNSPGPLAEVLPQLEVEPQTGRVNDDVVRLLARHGINAGGISIPGRRSRGHVEVIRVEGTAMPAPGVHAIESSVAEVNEVVRLLQERPDAAVVALNRRHADRIRVALGNPDVTVVAAEDLSGQRFDDVILAVGYAKTPHGRVIHDFGPYSQPEGEHLLAEALQSSRRDLTVVTSLDPDDIDAERMRLPGAQLFLDVLRIDGQAEFTDHEPWPTLELAPDNLLVDLAERLYAKGLNVVANLGVPGGLRIPLGIGHPEVPGQLLVAILTDDDTYVNEPSLRVRDHQIPALLEEQGWKVRTELSMAVFIDPNREADAIVELVLDAVDEHNRPDILAEPDPVIDVLDPVGADTETLEESAIVGLPDSTVPRPPIVGGLPLAAYGDDELDEVAQWVLSSEEPLSESEAIAVMREALQLQRRGSQSDAVLRNVIRRNRNGD